MKETIQARAQQLDPSRTKTIGSYVIGKTLGKGTFGKVKAATHIPTGQKVAVKILQKQKIVDVADVERVSREIHILKLIRHPNIIQLYEIIQTPKQLFLIMEYMQNGELFDYIVKSKKVPQAQACGIFQQIIGGIQYIHQLNIVHRDLKPQNLLIDYDQTIRIVDFGLSNTYRKDERLKTACGSPCYAAPEMIQGKNRYESIMVDIWSSGVILYAMLCGCLPFEDPQTSKLYQKILSGQYKVPKSLSEDSKDILAKILTVDPNKRYRIQDIRKHKWWSLTPPVTNSQGIVVGYHRIPIDQHILQQTVKLGFQANFTRKCIEANRHNDATTTYYLLLKKFVKQGGISRVYLGTKHFDVSLIQPVRKVFPDFHQQSKLTSFDQTTPHFHNRQKQRQPQKTSSHPGIGRKSYHLGSNVISRRRQLSYQQAQRNKLKQLYTPSNKLSHSIKQQNQTINPDRITYDSSPKERQTLNHPARDNIDTISNKYKQTYGVSLISRSKQKQRSQSKRRSLRKYQLSDIYQKADMNRTVAVKTNKATKRNKIGVDKGFENTLNTIDNIYKKPYVNRRFIYH